MTPTFRQVDFQLDLEFLLEMKSLINYEGDPAWFRGPSLAEYRVRWLSTPQPQAWQASLRNLIDHGEAIAEIWEESGRPIGYLQVSFSEIEGFGLKVAEISDIAVLPEYQRRGIGRLMLDHVEDVARNQGASLLRAEVGAQNVASKALHERTGFEIARVSYEKRL